MFVFLPDSKAGVRGGLFQNIMASRRTSTAPSSFKTTSTDAESSKSASVGAKVSNSAAEKKTTKLSGTIVKSRYLQSAEKTSLSKSNSLTNESTTFPQRPFTPKPTAAKPKVGTPTRRLMMPQAQAESTLSQQMNPSLLGDNVLQSTFANGHGPLPDFDISVIKETAKELEINPEDEKSLVEMETFLLAYLTAKMESNTSKCKAEAEAKLHQMMVEEQRLKNEVKEKKRQYLLKEKKKELNKLLDLQIDMLTPVVEASSLFTKDYKCFGAAVDTTRHELPVKNFFINGDGREFLEKAEACWKETEMLLQEIPQGDHLNNSTSLECLRKIKTVSKDISQQLLGTCGILSELSSVVCGHSVQVQRAIEEEELGGSRTLQLFHPKQ